MGGTPVSTIAASLITLDLLFDDLDALKIMMSLAQDENSTYLSATNTTVFDMVDLELVEIPFENGLMACIHLEDATAPRLTNFSLDLNSGLLTFTFDETVLVNTLDLTKVTIQSTQILTVGSTTSLTLTSGTLAPGSMPGTIVQVLLTDNDYDILNTNPNIARNTQNTLSVWLQVSLKIQISFHQQQFHQTMPFR